MRSALSDSARRSFVRRRGIVWGAMSLLAGLAAIGSMMLALDLARWRRVGVDVVADITRISECRDVDDGGQVCRFDVVFATADGREVRGALVRNVGLATYADASRRSLRIRYDPEDPARVSTDDTDPALPATWAVVATALLVVCIWRGTTGSRWLRRLDALASDASAPRRRMRMVLLRCTARGGYLPAPWAWIVDPVSAETRGLNLPLIRGQELIVHGGETTVEVLGGARPHGVVVLLVGGRPLYPRGRARRYQSSRRVEWEPIEQTF